MLYAPQPFEVRVRIASLASRPVNEDLEFPAGNVLRYPVARLDAAQLAAVTASKI